MDFNQKGKDMSKEKYQIEATLKNILYFIDDVKEQEKMLEILQNYNNSMPDGKLRDALQKGLLKAKKDYYSKVDFLVNDILDAKTFPKNREKISKLLQEIKPIVEKGEKSFWEKLVGLFSWS